MRYTYLSHMHCTRWLVFLTMPDSDHASSQILGKYIFVAGIATQIGAKTCMSVDEIAIAHICNTLNEAVVTSPWTSLPHISRPFRLRRFPDVISTWCRYCFQKSSEGYNTESDKALLTNLFLPCQAVYIWVNQYSHTRRPRLGGHFLF